MKLVMVAILLVCQVAFAQGPVDPYGPGPSVAPAPRAQRGQLRQLLLQHFDRNQDGRLEPRERMRAARALHRLAEKLMRQDMRQMRQPGTPGQAHPFGTPRQMRGDMRDQRRKRFIRRFDLNRDGNVGPGEIPPAVADELRPLDQDGDGWLQGDELP